MSRFAIAVILVWSAAAQPVEWKRPVAEKNFYLLTVIERDGALRKTVAADPALAAIANAKRQALRQECIPLETAAACYANALRFTEGELETARAAIERLGGPELDTLLRQSGMLQRHHSLGAGKLAAHAWLDAARGIHHVMDVFALGQKPRYALIDSPSFDVKSERYGRLMRVVATVMEDEAAADDLFFAIPLRFALHLLEANWRDEAGRFEPMHRGENAAAYAAIATTRWDRFPYTVIVVPGSGTDRPNATMSPWGKLRVQLAAKRYRDGKAPFLIVSGGYVHPAQTPHCEALEMKKALMRDYGVPEAAILIDPHARHTTTNLRNAARLMYRYGIPFDRKAMITTDLDQSRSIESQGFVDRCNRELGYQPHRLLQRLSPSDLEFLPRIESMTADASDPLDP
jgi:hypothetical protein